MQASILRVLTKTVYALWGACLLTGIVTNVAIKRYPPHPLTQNRLKENANAFWAAAQLTKNRKEESRLVTVISAKLLTVFLTDCVLLLEIKNGHTLKVRIYRAKQGKSIELDMVQFLSGQRGQIANLLHFASMVRIRPLLQKQHVAVLAVLLLQMVSNTVSVFKRENKPLRIFLRGFRCAVAFICGCRCHPEADGSF